MYLILFIIHISITVTGQKLGLKGNKGTLDSSCFVLDFRHQLICIDLEICPQQQPYPQTCVYENIDHLLCCPDLENTIIRPYVKYVDRDLSNKRIINKCYNNYADRRDDGSLTCTFAENWMLNTCRLKQNSIPKHNYTATLGWRRDNNEYDFKSRAYLVTRYFLITSAHSVDRGFPDIVRFAERKNKCTYYDQEINVNDVYIHPEYKPHLAYNDIAIIKLSEEADERFILYCIWVDDDNLVPNLLATRHDNTKPGGYDLEMFYELNKTDCNNKFSREPRLKDGITNSQLCGNAAERKRDISKIDSTGGPLFTELTVIIKPDTKIPKKIWYIMGISSDGVRGKPLAGVYTKVSSYVNWIDSIVFASSPPKIEFREEDRKINSSCFYRATGQFGTCVNINICTSLISRLQKISPQYCFFEVNQPIVCCPNDEKLSTKIVKRNISRSKIINMCYNYYFNIAFSRIGKFDENCYIQKIRNARKRNTCTPEISTKPGIWSERVPILDHMYMASLGWRRDNGSFEFQCGAFLIARNFVLTAAHCMKDGLPNIVRLGDKIYTKEYSQDINIAKISIHPEYLPYLTYNDIALIKLAVEAKKQFILACLWVDDADLAPDLKAIGFGATKPGGPTSDELYQVSLQLMNKTVCNNQFSEDYRLPNGIISSQLCAGDPEGKMDTCKGDSGGPLFTKIRLIFAPECKFKAEIAHVLGITSFGPDCAQSFAGGYIRVLSYLDWIDSIIFGN